MEGGPGSRQAELRHLFALLTEYLGAVPRQKEANPPDLLAIYGRIDEQERKVQGFVDDRLRHFLHQKSYRKAWLYMQGEDVESQ